MAIELHRLLSDAIQKYETKWDIRRRRETDRQVCEAHPDWVPLTADELSRIDKEERWGYTIMKNMAPDCSQIEFFVTKVIYLLRIVPMLNPQNHPMHGTIAIDCMFADKNYHELFMPELRFPNTVVRRVGGSFFNSGFERISQAEAMRLLSEHDALVFKKTFGTAHGRGVRKVPKSEYESVITDFAENYIAQELVRQHPVLSYFNPSSVNVIRLTTLAWRGDVYLLGGILRVGAPGAFCDHENKDGENFLSIPLADDGTILPRPVDMDGHRVFSDCRGIPVKGVIPGYEDLKRSVLAAHGRYPNFGLIGWDVTIGEDGYPVFMEFNTKYPGLNGTQFALGPVLAQKSVRGVPLLDELMEELHAQNYE